MDTLPQWLYQRFGNGRLDYGWDELEEDDKSYWAHQAAAVRRAVERGGFKNPEAQGLRFCHAYYGTGNGGMAYCRRHEGHPPISEDGIGHSPKPDFQKEDPR